MSGPVYIQAQSIATVQPEGGPGNRSIGIELEMTERQAREAVLNLLVGMTPTEAREWLRSELPEWFPAVPAWAVEQP